MRHPDFYVAPEVPQKSDAARIWNTICWVIVIILVPFDVIAITALCLLVGD